MTTNHDSISKLIQEKKIEDLKAVIKDLNDLVNGDYEHIVHHAFQIQDETMKSPPCKETMATLCSSDLISPIFKGIYTEDLDLIKKTIKEDPGALERRDASTYTPFLRAAETCKVDTINLLVEEGADIYGVRDDDFGGGALHIAAWNAVNPGERYQTLKRLIELGCNVNALTKADATPMMLAALCRHASSIRCLLEHGADRDLVSNEGKTALDYAKESDLQNGIDFLTIKYDKIFKSKLKD
jgi:hypothetical protein